MRNSISKILWVNLKCFIKNEIILSFTNDKNSWKNWWLVLWGEEFRLILSSHITVWVIILISLEKGQTLSYGLQNMQSHWLQYEAYTTYKGIDSL